MNQQSTSASSANGRSSPAEIFALTDEQILEMDPDPQDVQVTAARSDAPPAAGQNPPPASEGAPVTSLATEARDNPPSPTTAPAAPFAAPEDARALAELYPGGLPQAKNAAERARLLDDIDRAYFGAQGSTPEQTQASRAQLAAMMLREDPAAFREMLFAGLRALEAAEAPARARSVADALGHASATATNTAATSANNDAGVAPPIPAAPHANHAQSASPAPQEHLAAYTAFEKAANQELERSVGAAIDRALQQALPNLGRADESANAGARQSVPLQARLSSAIRDEVEKSLQGDRQLGEQVAQILSSRRFDNETRAQIVRLINDRAQQLVPGAAKRALNDWTQATLAAHRARTRHADANASRVDLSPAIATPAGTRFSASPAPATGQGSAGQAASSHSAASSRGETARAASARTALTNSQRSSRVDYHKLSDEQILGL